MKNLRGFIICLSAILMVVNSQLFLKPQQGTNPRRMAAVSAAMSATNPQVSEAEEPDDTQGLEKYCAEVIEQKHLKGFRGYKFIGPYSFRSKTTDTVVVRLGHLVRYKSAILASRDDRGYYIESSLWIDDEMKRLVVWFQDTSGILNWLNNLGAVLTHPEPWEQYGSKELTIHKGFWQEYQPIRDCLKDLLEKHEVFVKLTKGYDLIVTGWSLGGARATVFTADLFAGGLITDFMKKVAKVSLVTFGAPVVGTNCFAQWFNKLGLKHNVRVAAEHDPIVLMHKSEKSGFCHAGKLVMFENVFAYGEKVEDGSKPMLASRKVHQQSKCSITSAPLGDCVARERNMLSNLNSAAEALVNVFSRWVETGSFEQAKNDFYSHGGYFEFYGLDKFVYSKDKDKIRQDIMDLVGGPLLEDKCVDWGTKTWVNIKKILDSHHFMSAEGESAEQSQDS